MMNPEQPATLCSRRALLACVSVILAASWADARAAEFDCLISPKRMVTISGSIEALITSVRVDRGDFVKKGDVLVEFEAGVERASAELAKYRSEMLGQVEARRARQEYAQAKYNRSVELSKANFVSRQDGEEAQAEQRLAEAELREAIDSRRLAELEYKRSVEMLRLRQLRSPVTGVVVDRFMHPGEISEIGQKPILKLAEISTLFVEAVLPTSAYGQVARGDIGVVSPEAPIGGRYEAKVTVVDKVLDASSGTFRVRLELPNEKNVLPAGARCSVALSRVRGATPRPPRTVPR